MKVDLVLIEVSDKYILSDLLREYEKELTGEDVDEYKYLDLYWERPDRFPYFIKVDNKIAGFVLVNSHVLVQVGGKNLAEFYVKKEYRKNGIGKNAAFKVFDLFPGKWEVRETKKNKQAYCFWSNVLAEYTKNTFMEIALDDENWSGPVQTFDNSK